MGNPNGTSMIVMTKRENTRNFSVPSVPLCHKRFHLSFSVDNPNRTSMIVMIQNRVDASGVAVTLSLRAKVSLPQRIRGAIPQESTHLSFSKIQNL